MIIISICRSEITCWCPLCGTLNVTDKGDVNECEHFEGMISMNEFVVGDKNGIMNEANEAAYNLKNFGDNFDGTDEECREAYVEACKKHNVNTDQQDGIFASNILESKLDDHYVLFDMDSPDVNNHGPSNATGIYLYNFGGE